MISIGHIVLFYILLFPLSVMAEDKLEIDEFTLMKQAVEYSTKADVYNAHCDKPSSLTDDFIKKFEEKRGLNPKSKSILLDMQSEYKKETRDKIKGADCRDIEFMLKRLEIMRHLKDISYLLNGADPSTIPKDNIPNLEGLLPPKNVIPDISQDL